MESLHIFDIMFLLMHLVYEKRIKGQNLSHVTVHIWYFADTNAQPNKLNYMPWLKSIFLSTYSEMSNATPSF